MDWKKYGLVISSSYRKRVLTSISLYPKTPKQIATETNIYLSHVSKTLKELVSHGLAICLTPTLKRGRVYEITEEGREISTIISRGNST